MAEQSEFASTDRLARDDVRAAVTAGVLDENEARQLLTFVQTRHGTRNYVPSDDEPFVLFSGFSEVFVSIGLVLLFPGIYGVWHRWTDWGIGNHSVMAIVLSALLAGYYTRVRRMTLPSIVLAVVFAVNLVIAIGHFFLAERNPDFGEAVLTITLPGFLLFVLYYWIFRLPFSLFLLGLFGFASMTGIGAILQPETVELPTELMLVFFDLRQSTFVAVSSLLYGLIAFAAAMYFDLKDPHRVSRHSDCAFWLHVVSAPALTNTIAMTFYNLQNLTGYVLTAIALFAIAAVAIVIDRRSLLTVGLIYIGLILAFALEKSGIEENVILSVLILGLFVTVLGTWWVAARIMLMTALPAFPMKDRLPPYGGLGTAF